MTDLGSESGPRDGPVNILIVDDQPAKLLGYRAILEDLGETLLMAHSARSALEMLLQNDVALLLVDVVMPELDGFELVEMIRTHPRFEKTAVIFVSGVHLSDIDRIRGYAAGAVDYVPVPVVPELLRAKVRIFADLYRKTRQLESLNQELADRICARTADLEASTQRWKASEERLRLALESARAGAWEWRFPSGEMRWSPELFALLGLSASTGVPTIDEFLAHVDAEDRPTVAALLQSLRTATEGPAAFDLEFRFHRPGERTPMWLRTAGEVVMDAEGRPMIARGIYKDETTRKQAELELEDEARRKDEFLATLAHELRNPLSPMLSCVRMLKSGTLEHSARARHQNILEGQVHHLVRLVDDLLDVSRISRGVIALQTQPIDLATLVRQTVDATLLRGSGHVVVTDIPERGPCVAVDPVRIAQVITNILDNAMKFTAAGGTIRLSLSVEADQAVLRITDSGIGIAPHNLERVFDLFTQVEGRGPGLGIGLALVRRLLELQGGTVRAYSRGMGQGTEIIVRLPCSPERQREDAPAEHMGATKEYQPVRFLVVDDNVLAADTLAELLELSGYRARAIYGGREAIQVGEGFEPDVVLLDLGMPIMDGFETAQRVRQTKWGTRAKIVAVTGWGQASDRKRSAEAGFDGHLVKPVELEAVVKLVEMVDSRS